MNLIILKRLWRPHWVIVAMMLHLVLMSIGFVQNAGNMIAGSIQLVCAKDIIELS